MADHTDDPEPTDRVVDAEASGQVGDGGEGVVCPMPCERCDALGPGGCEDCLDCLLWPEVPPGRSTGGPPLPGRTSPTKTAELRAARTRLAIVPLAPADATELIARDGARRRPPPYGQVTRHSLLDRRMNGNEAEWTWRHAPPHEVS